MNDFLTAVIASTWLLPVMFALAVVDGFFPPVPSETVLVAAVAVAATTGAVPTTIAVCLVAAVGAVIGDNIAYAIGRRIGARRHRWMGRPRVAAAFARAQAGLERRGAPLILGARYIPIGRVAVNMSAGALSYPWRRFAPLSVVAGLTWALYSALIGTVAGRWLGDQPVLSAALGIAVALVVGVAVDRVLVLRQRRAAAAAA